MTLLRQADQNAGYNNYAEKAVLSSNGFMIGQHEAGIIPSEVAEEQGQTWARTRRDDGDR